MPITCSIPCSSFFFSVAGWWCMHSHEIRDFGKTSSSSFCREGGRERLSHNVRFADVRGGWLLHGAGTGPLLIASMGEE